MQETYNADGSRETKDLTGVGETYSTTGHGYKTTGSIVNEFSSKEFEGVNGASARVTDGKVNGVKTDSGVTGGVKDTLTENAQTAVKNAQAEKKIHSDELANARQKQKQVALDILTDAKYGDNVSREQLFQEANKSAFKSALMDKFGISKEHAEIIASKVSFGIDGSLSVPFSKIANISAGLGYEISKNSSDTEKIGTSFEKAWQRERTKEIGKVLTEKAGLSAGLTHGQTAKMSDANANVDSAIDKYSEAIEKTTQAEKTLQHTKTHGLDIAQDLLTVYAQTAYDRGGEHGLQNALNKIGTMQGAKEVLGEFAKDPNLYKNLLEYDKTNQRLTNAYDAQIKPRGVENIDLDNLNARNVASTMEVGVFWQNTINKGNTLEEKFNNGQEEEKTNNLIDKLGGLTYTNDNGEKVINPNQITNLSMRDNTRANYLSGIGDNAGTMFNPHTGKLEPFRGQLFYDQSGRLVPKE